MSFSGRVIFAIIITLLLFSSTVRSITPHEDFNKADLDLYSIISFLDDTIIICEDALENSYLVNGSIYFEETLSFVYDENFLALSIEKSDDLMDRLSYSTDIIGQIKNKASSYDYLKDYMVILKNLGLKVTDFIKYHENIIMNFSIIIDFIGGIENESDTIYSLINTRTLISDSEKILIQISQELNSLSDSFSIFNLQEIISNLFGLLERYNNYIDTLTKLIKIEEPTLFLYVTDNSVYLGENFTAFGYFIANYAFVSDQDINLYWDDSLIKSALTDDAGRFEFVVPISFETNPGNYSIFTSTIFNNTIYYSNNVSISVNKIPTTISLTVPKNDFYIDELISFSGRLVDYNKKGIESDLFLNFAGFNITLKSNVKGNFSYFFNKTLSFGKYKATFSFYPLKYYESSSSKIIEIRINTPTVLTIYSSKIDYNINDQILINGSLKNGIDNSPISYKKITLFLNNKKIGSAETDKIGKYEFILKTNNFSEGKYNVYSRFISDDFEWRDADSENIELNMKIFSSQNFLSVIILFIILVSAFIIFIFRNKIVMMIFRKQIPLAEISEIKEKAKKSEVTKESIIDINDFTVDINVKKTDGFKDSVIEKYQALLEFLSNKGINISKNFTHLEIRKQMLKKGFSRRATNIVTKAFEYAKYSPYSFDKKDVILFNKSVKVILKNLGVK